MRKVHPGLCGSQWNINFDTNETHSELVWNMQWWMFSTLALQRQGSGGLTGLWYSWPCGAFHSNQMGDFAVHSPCQIKIFCPAEEGSDGLRFGYLKMGLISMPTSYVALLLDGSPDAFQRSRAQVSGFKGFIDSPEYSAIQWEVVNWGYATDECLKLTSHINSLLLNVLFCDQLWLWWWKTLAWPF